MHGYPWSTTLEYVHGVPVGSLLAPLFDSLFWLIVPRLLYPSILVADGSGPRTHSLAQSAQTTSLNPPPIQSLTGRVAAWKENKEDFKKGGKEDEGKEGN